jgi:hypothetical protein
MGGIRFFEAHLGFMGIGDLGIFIIPPRQHGYQKAISDDQ